MTHPHPQRCDDIAPGELWTYNHPWKVFRRDAGMGEKEYRLFLNNEFFAQVDSNEDADKIIEWYSATHAPAAPAERLCDDCNIIELEEKVMHLEQQVKDEREKVLADEIIPWIEQYCFKPAFGESVVPKKALCKFLKSLRDGAP